VTALAREPHDPRLRGARIERREAKSGPRAEAGSEEPAPLVGGACDEDQRAGAGGRERVEHACLVLLAQRVGVAHG
jgi:hypothetical protein